MILSDLIATIPGPQRIRISTVRGKEIFQGYHGIYRSNGEYDDCEVDRTGLFTYITPKNKLEELLYSTEKMQPIPDNLTHMEFSDLGIAIYLDIVIKA